jgi:1-acyl-sn-glycerol-3-phosphate acyltransferase
MRHVLRWMLRTLINVIAKVDVRGYENVPATGAFIIATNHIGMLDAAMLYYAVNRWDVFIPVAEKWEQNAFLRWVGKFANFVFIDRFHPDLKAMRKIIAMMDKGNILVIAPEGTRSTTASMNEGRPGASYLAAKLNRSIIPVGLAGTEDRLVLENLKHFRRSHIVVTAGKLFSLPPLPTKDRDQTLHQFTDEIMCQIAAVLPEKYRGVYALHPRLKELLLRDSG